MRDTETVRAALQAAETGHLVMSTLHTQDATETVNRVIDFFPPHQQKQIRLSLAGTLRGIICQRLVPSVDGSRIPALEILVNTGRVAERIADDEKTSEIEEVVAEGGYYGMMTFDQALLNLIKVGKVSVEDAMQAVSSVHDFELALQQAGIPIPPPTSATSASSGSPATAVAPTAPIDEPSDAQPPAKAPQDAFLGAPSGS
jgi:twitching motility protein PilT